ncbi:MAG: T9SS type A sorting domain-containing protein [Ignavibacteriales bacterium]|nr:T9SS type A sorting domain-containing protein [Ignavibacteriales bacterium]
MKMIGLFYLTVILLGVIFGKNESAVFSKTNYPIQPSTDSVKYLNLPERPLNSISGSEFVKAVSGKSVVDREKAVVKEILSGNVPSFSRKLIPLKINQTINSINYETIIYTTCDYMAIGSDEDYLYIPMTPSTAQYLAKVLYCSLPTKKNVDLIYNQAEIKLKPQPIPPSNQMTTIPVFNNHTDSIKLQISLLNIDREENYLFAGHKKDIIISNKIYTTDRNYDRVVIYGWHLSVNNPIQPVYNGHIASYADYSHGVRLISDQIIVNGDTTNIANVLRDPLLSNLISSEGVIKKPYYPASNIFTSMMNDRNDSENSFSLYQNYPNPFNPNTKIDYMLNQNSFVDLSIYDCVGQKITVLVNGNHKRGNYSSEFFAGNLPSGIYFYKLSSENFSSTKKMLLIK